MDNPRELFKKFANNFFFSITDDSHIRQISSTTRVVLELDKVTRVVAVTFLTKQVNNSVVHENVLSSIV